MTRCLYNLSNRSEYRKKRSVFALLFIQEKKVPSTDNESVRKNTVSQITPELQSGMSLHLETNSQQAGKLGQLINFTSQMLTVRKIKPQNWLRQVLNSETILNLNWRFFLGLSP